MAREVLRAPRAAARSAADEAFIERFERRMALPLVAAAVLPLIIVSDNSGWVPLTVDVASWIVFVVDYVVHERHLVHYGRSWLGRFDLFVVVVTAPWWLIPGVHSGNFVVLLRFARLARVMMASRGGRRLFQRLGSVAAVAFGVVFIGSVVAYHAEHATNPEFATFGDSLWWGIVTLTTVGYGDIVPKTPQGRFAGVVIMITGIAVLGLLSGSLASFFRPGGDTTTSSQDETSEETSQGDESGPGPRPESVEGALGALTAELAELRQRIEGLSELVARSGREEGG